MSKLDAWEADGADYRRHVLAACRDFAGKKLTATKGPAYLGAIIARLQAEAPAVRTTSVSAGPDPRAPESDFKAMRRLECHAKGEWYDAWGPPPGMAGCLIPDRIFAEFDARKAA